MTFPPTYDVDFSSRKPLENVDEIFHQRWSPRSFQKRQLPEETIRTVIDAARWSPSAFNEQPWLFVTSSNAEEFNTFLGLLVDRNQKWAANASLIGFIFAKRHHEYNESPNRYYFFDCGAAWMAMTLQARKLGLYTHGMGGIHRNETYKTLGVPEETFEVVCGFALGILDEPQKLAEEFRESEKPSPRIPLEKIWKQGCY